MNAQGGSYGNALQAASMRGHASIVELLLANEANVNAQGGSYGNALQAASMRGHASIVELLLANEANVNAQGGSYGNALQAASYWGNIDVVRLLLKHGAFDPDGNALSGAAYGGYGAIVAMLLQASKIGLNDALIAACKGKSWRDRVSQDKVQGVVAMLLDAGAVDLHGEALIGAAKEGYTSVIARLLKVHNVGVDEALVSACKRNTARGREKTQEEIRPVVILLLNAGAVDRKGHALQEATKRGYAEVAALLEEAAEKNKGRISENAEN